MEENCPKCLREINNNNRLITELCGHLKCRLCLLFETNQCAECELSTKNSNILENQSDINKNQNICEEINHNNITIIENIIIEPRTINLNSQSNSNSSSTSHIIKESSGFKCTICNKSFQSRNQKYYHLYCKNAETKPYKCTVCPRAFSSSYHLKYHLENHTGKTYKCTICSKMMANKITYEKHVKNHKTLKIYNCELCSKKYKDLISYNDHLNKHNNIYPYSCNNCDKKFSSNSNLVKHKKIYTVFEKKFKCNQCGNTFFRKSSLKSHILKHSNKNSYNCNICSKSFSDKKSLLRHQNVHNDAIQMYQCEFCDVKIVRKDNLLRHIRNMHPNENQNKIIKFNNNIKLQSNVSNENISNDKIDNSNIESSNDEIIIASSVIRSIGNVKPLNITSTNSETNISTLEEVMPNTDDKLLNDFMTTSSTTIFSNKKIKKKYDPCEIYRKILFASNDEDSTLETEEPNNIEPSKENEFLKDFNNKSIQIPVQNNDSNNLTYSNFSEKHWRKNFTYNYKNNS